MLKRNLRGNLIKIAIIKALRWFMLALPIIVLFYQENGLTLKDFLTIKAVFAVVILITEIPSGYLADLVSRKFSIIVANIFSTLAIFVYCFSETYTAFLVAEVLTGLGVSLMSGADSALVYDTVAELKKLDQYKKIEGRLLFVTSSSEAISAVIGGSLALISLRTPLFYQLGVLFAAIPLSFFLVEPTRTKLDTSSGKWNTLIEVMKGCLHRSQMLKWTILYTSSSATSTFVMVWFLQPYWKEIGLPLAYFGLAWSLLNVSIGFFALTTGWFEKFLGTRRMILMLTILIPISFAATGYLHNLWCFIPLLVLYFVRGVRTPFFKHLINEQTTSDQRATVLSVQSMLLRVIFMIMAPTLGWIADTYSLSVAFYVCAVFFGSLLVICQIGFFKYLDIKKPSC